MSEHGLVNQQSWEAISLKLGMAEVACFNLHKLGADIQRNHDCLSLLRDDLILALQAHADTNTTDINNIQVHVIGSGLGHSQVLANQTAISTINITDLPAIGTDISNLQTHATGDGSDHSVTASNAVKVAGLAEKIFPPGQHTTVGGGVSEDITVTGATATHICQVTMAVVGASPVTLLTAVCGTDKVTLTFSADPSNDHVVNYTVLK